MNRHYPEATIEQRKIPRFVSQCTFTWDMGHEVGIDTLRSSTWIETNIQGTDLDTMTIIIELEGRPSGIRYHIQAFTATNFITTIIIISRCLLPFSHPATSRLDVGSQQSLATAICGKSHSSMYLMARSLGKIDFTCHRLPFPRLPQISKYKPCAVPA